MSRREGRPRALDIDAHEEPARSEGLHHERLNRDRGSESRDRGGDRHLERGSRRPEDRDRERDYDRRSRDYDRGRSHDRSRDRDSDRHSRSERPRDYDKHRDRDIDDGSIDRSRRDRSSFKERDERQPEAPEKSNAQKEAPKRRSPVPQDIPSDAELEEEDVAQLMGFGGFASTKGEHVEGNGETVFKKQRKKARKFRQYMNRKGGFNRKLDGVQ